MDKLVCPFSEKTAKAGMQSDNEQQDNRLAAELLERKKSLPLMMREYVEISGEYLPAAHFESQKYSIVANVHVGRVTPDWVFFQNVSASYRQTDVLMNPDLKDLYTVGLVSRVIHSNIDKIRFFELGIESSSDKPFNSIDEVDMYMLAFHKWRTWGRHGLNMGVYFDPRLKFLNVEGIPLPFVFYEYGGDWFQARLGPETEFYIYLSENLGFNFQIDLDINAYSSLLYSLAENFNIALEWVMESDLYLLANREDKNEGIVLEGDRAGIRITIQTGPGLRVDTFVGYASDNRYYYLERGEFLKGGDGGYTR